MNPEMCVYIKTKIPSTMEKISSRLEKQSNFIRCVTAEEELVLTLRKGIIPVL
jgi:hypothetical protein